MSIPSAVLVLSRWQHPKTIDVSLYLNLMAHDPLFPNFLPPPSLMFEISRSEMKFCRFFLMNTTMCIPTRF